MFIDDDVIGDAARNQFPNGFYESTNILHQIQEKGCFQGCDIAFACIAL